MAFESAANNLSDDDAPVVRDVFLRDLQMNTTTLVSDVPGAPIGTSQSKAPAISADGRYVAFETEENLFVTSEDENPFNVVRRDMQGGFDLVSRADGVAGAGANNASVRASISSDGTRVAFTSSGSNLTSGIASMQNIFVRDLVAGTTELASRADGAAGAGGTGTHDWAQISDNGRYVTFYANSNNLISGGPSGGDYVRDLQDDLTTLVSRFDGAGGAAATSPGLYPSISADGRYVAFTSTNNLSGDGAVGTTSVYVRDRQASTTTLVSRAAGAAGAPGTGDSQFSSISRDGRWVAFDTAADNISTDDVDGVREVFLRQVLDPPPPTPVTGLRGRRCITGREPGIAIGAHVIGDLTELRRRLEQRAHEAVELRRGFWLSHAPLRIRAQRSLPPAMEPAGLEPAASDLQSRRSPN